MIAVVDYGRGNLFSIGQALRHLNATFTITEEALEIAAADGLILPGVGAFGDAMAALEGTGLVGPIREAAAARTPILGICLGMQLLCDHSEEFGNHAGLGLIPGSVKKLPHSVMKRLPR